MRQPLPIIDTDTPAFYEDPNSVLLAGDERPELANTAYGIEVFSYRIVRDIFRESRFTPRRARYFREVGASALVMEFVERGAFNFMEPVDHDRIRAIVSKGFRPKRIESARPMMRETAEGLIDQFIDAGRCDLVADFTHFFPLAVIARFIGADPGELQRLTAASVTLRLLGQRPLAPHLPALEEAFETLVEYTRGLIADRRREPREDFVSEMLASQNEPGGGLTDEEVVWGVVFLFLAGHDTTRFTLSSCLKLLADSGAWEQLAAQPELASKAISESMRLRPGTPRQIRVAHETFSFAGYDFDEGDVLALNFVAAGRDPAAYSSPEEFVLDRRPQYGVGFGLGAHVCVGTHIARTEMQEAIESLTNRLSRVQITGPITLKTGGIIGGFDSLPTTFERRVPDPVLV